jgi:hypothetical protein
VLRLRWLQPPAPDRVLVGLAAQAVGCAGEEPGAVDEVPGPFGFVPVLAVPSGAATMLAKIGITASIASRRS